MKFLATGALAVTIFIIAASLLMGGLAVLSLVVGGDDGPNRILQWAALVMGLMLSGMVTVYLLSRVMKDMGSMRLWAYFSVTLIITSFVFTAPWYLKKDGIGHGTPEALQAVILGVVMAIIGGYLGRMITHRLRTAQAVREREAQDAACRQAEQAMAEAQAESTHQPDAEHRS